METKRVILARLVDFDSTQTMRYHGNRISEFLKNSFFDENFLENLF